MDERHIFDPLTQTMLEPLSGDTLQFKSTLTGQIYEATTQDTLLFHENIGTRNFNSKFQKTLKATAFDPVNPFIEKECPKCKRQLIKYQRLGDKKKVIYEHT